MARGNRSEHNQARIVSLDAHRARKAKPTMMSRIKDALVGGPGNPDLDDPNTPEYTGQEARLSDIAPRNLVDKAKGTLDSAFMTFDTSTFELKVEPTVSS